MAQETLSQRIARQKATRLAGADVPTRPEDWQPLIEVKRHLGDFTSLVPLKVGDKVKAKRAI